MPIPDFRYPLGTILLVAAGLEASQSGTPQQAVDELLAADRAYAAASAGTDVVSGISAMFAADVVLPLPGGKFANGISAAREALSASAENAGARVEWAPIRGGISADGLHGFTFGYMKLHKADQTTAPAKYLAYWIRTAEGWRVAVYKRSRRPDSVVSTALLPAALPPHMVKPSTGREALEAFRRSLDRAERDFSDAAQRIGLGAAFAKYGSADAVNMGGPAAGAFVMGSEAIGRAVSAGDPPGGSPVSWAPDRVIVASSGDLGVTIGMIRPNARPADGAQPAGFAFFTIWRRATPNDPWRYVAE
jgi:ketosteroid isomerase-like protein